MAGGLAETALLLSGSIAMSAIVVLNAFYQKEQFYSSVVYITKSNASMAIMYVQALVGVYLFGTVMKKIFFGTLRPAEFEHVVERSWYALTETCLAFTVFRDDLSPKFVALFTCLFSLKLFHWLAEDRVDYMERSPNISLLFHVRINSLLVLLGFLDLYSVYSAYQSITENGPSVQLVFGFEYAILFAVVINIGMKYVLHTLDMNNENPWEDKAIYLLYTELIMSVLKIALYTIFIVIMVRFHAFPLFAIRPMYLAIKSFRSSYKDIVMSRQAIQNMNTLYPNATEEDIANSDNVCIICRDIMHGNGTCKKLPCNHILHISCLRSWFQRQQTCPTCRMDVLQNLRTHRAGRERANINLNNLFNNNNNNVNNNMNNNNNNNNANNNNNNNNQQNSQQQGSEQNAQNNNNNNNNNNQANRQMPQMAGVIFGNQVWPPNIRLFGQQNGNAPQAQPPQQSSSANAGEFPASASAETIPEHIFQHLSTAPFPMPDLSVSSFFNRYTEQQLRDMEGHHRENIEARLKLLADTQVLIDCAIAQLTQYNSIITNMKPTPAQQPSSSTATTSASATATTASTATTTANGSVAAGGDSGQSSSSSAAPGRPNTSCPSSAAGSSNASQ